nr:hypothetical protein [uncultured Holophaga sp.]
MSALDPRQELEEDYPHYCHVISGRNILKVTLMRIRLVNKIYKEMYKMKKKGLPVPTLDQKRVLHAIYASACLELGRKSEPFNPKAMQEEWDKEVNYQGED